ncbi:MAG: hypothetical protein ACK41G_11845 [Candidatus Thermochlorobacter sp.]
MSARCVAIAGALFLGRHKSHDAGQAHVPAHIPFVGTKMLQFGWFGSLRLERRKHFSIIFSAL